MNSIQKAIIAFWILCSISKAWGGSFEALNREFKKALPPISLEQLYLGITWSCSNSVAAAQKNFRYVQIWQPLIRFHAEPEGIISNRSSLDLYRQFEFLDQGDLVSFSEADSGRALAIRMTDDGDMVLAHLKRKDQKPTAPLREFGLSSNWIFEKFDICEKPSRHGEKNWENSGEIWIYNQ